MYGQILIVQYMHSIAQARPTMKYVCLVHTYNISNTYVHTHTYREKSLQLSQLHRKTLFADVLISYQLLEIGENIGKGTYRATRYNIIPC